MRRFTNHNPQSSPPNNCDSATETVGGSHEPEGVIDLCSSDEEGTKVGELYPIKYPEGKFLLTHLPDYPNTGIKFDAILDKRYVNRALLSSFVVDYPWLDTMLKEGSSVCVIESWSPKTELGGNRLLKPNFLVCHPPLTGRQTMHAKLMLLTYPKFLRLVISSANLVPYDWSSIENVVFVQDFPHLVDHQTTTNNHKRFKLSQEATTTVPNIKKDLRSFLSACKVPESVLSIVEPYDFREAKVELVMSIPGTQSGRTMLSNKLHSLIPNLTTATRAKLLYQTSSLGSITDEFIQLYWDTLFPGLKGQPPNFKLIFPSRDTVMSSKLGPEGGGTIFFNAYNYHTTFPKSILHDAISLRAGSLSHSKIMMGEVHPSSTTDPIRFLYYGSHNFSGAAWGNKPNNHSNCTINNYELGVLHLAPPNYTPPFLFPPPAYATRDEPWIQPGLGGTNKFVKKPNK